MRRKRKHHDQTSQTPGTEKMLTVETPTLQTSEVLTSEVQTIPHTQTLHTSQPQISQLQTSSHPILVFRQLRVYGIMEADFPFIPKVITLVVCGYVCPIEVISTKQVLTLGKACGMWTNHERFNVVYDNGQSSLSINFRNPDDSKLLTDAYVGRSTPVFQQTPNVGLVSALKNFHHRIDYHLRGGQVVERTDLLWCPANRDWESISSYLPVAKIFQSRYDNVETLWAFSIPHHRVYKFMRHNDKKGAMIKSAKGELIYTHHMPTGSNGYDAISYGEYALIVVDMDGFVDQFDCRDDKQHEPVLTYDRTSLAGGAQPCVFIRELTREYFAVITCCSVHNECRMVIYRFNDPRIIAQYPFNPYTGSSGMENITKRLFQNMIFSIENHVGYFVCHDSDFNVDILLRLDL